MHDEPHVKRHLERVRQNRNEVGRAAGDGVLTAPDPDAGAKRGELGEVAVAAKAEILAGERLRERNVASSRSKPIMRWFARSASECGSPKRAR